MAKELKTGDVVTLKSRGLPMTIEHIAMAGRKGQTSVHQWLAEQRIAFCVWFDEIGIQRDVFALEALTAFNLSNSSEEQAQHVCTATPHMPSPLDFAVANMAVDTVLMKTKDGYKSYAEVSAVGFSGIIRQGKDAFGVLNSTARAVDGKDA